MLVYHPAFDSYHCLFRAIAILEVCRKSEPDRLRILDFCLSFPTAIGQFRLPPGKAVIKRAAQSTASPYRDPISPKAVFTNLTAIQLAAFSCLVATNLVSIQDGFMFRTATPVPDPIRLRCLEMVSQEKIFFETLLSQLTALPLLGPDGLKARSGLMEHRYDAI